MRDNSFTFRDDQKSFTNCGESSNNLSANNNDQQMTFNKYSSNKLFFPFFDSNKQIGSFKRQDFLNLVNKSSKSGFNNLSSSIVSSSTSIALSPTNKPSKECLDPYENKYFYTLLIFFVLNFLMFHTP